MSYKVIGGRLVSFDNIKGSCNYAGNKLKNSEAVFTNILNKEIKKDDSFLISNHAALRIKNRKIELNEDDMKVINDGINKASDKGSKECLLLYKDMALVASVRNRTIITAVSKDESHGNVFTNIDSVVLL